MQKSDASNSTIAVLKKRIYFSEISELKQYKLTAK